MTGSDPGGWPALTVEQVNQIFEHVPAAVAVFDQHARIAYANRVVAALLGYTADELLELPIDAVIEACSDGVEVDLHEAIRDLHGPRHLGPGQDIFARRRDGGLVPVEIRVIPVAMEGGGSWTVAGLEDVTERREVEQRAEWFGRSYLTLAQQNEVAVRASSREELYLETCRVAVEVGGYLGAWVVTLNANGTGSVAAAAGVVRGFQEVISLDPLEPTGRGPTALALRENRTFVSSDYLTDPRTEAWRDLYAELGIGASCSMPLHVHGAVVAALTLFGRSGTFDDGVDELCERVAVNVSYALDAFAARDALEQAAAAAASARDDLARVAVERRELARRLVTAQETERRRIADDLHDDPVQSLVAIELRLGLLSREIGERAPTALPIVTTIHAAVARTVQSLRDLMFELEPEIGSRTWADMVGGAAAYIFEGQSVAWTLTSPPDVRLSEIERTQALRIIKEALINARKHAQASTVDIVVSDRDEGVEVEITDDGVGMGQRELEELERNGSPAGHRGLTGMRDRAAVVGGWARLESAATGGTTLRFWLPREPAAS